MTNEFRPAPEADTPPRRRRLGRAWLLTTTANASLGLVVFVVNPWVSNILGPDGRGRLTAIQLVPQMLADLSSVGLGFSIIHFGSAKRDSLRALMGWSVKPAIVGSIVMFALGQLLVSPILGDNKGDVRFMRVYLLICPLTAVVVVSAEALRARGDFGRWNLFVFTRGLTWPMALVVGMLGEPSIGRIVYVHLGLTAVIAVLVAMVVRRQTGGESADPGVTPRDHVRYGLLSAASTIPRTANAKLDQVVMSFRVSDGDLGLYSAAVGWSGVTLPVMRGFTGIAMPHVSGARDDQVSTRVRHIVTTAWLATVVLLLLGWIMTLLVWHVRYNDEFNRAYAAALILIPAGLLLEYNAILANVLRSLHRPGVVAILEIVVLTVSTISLLIVLTRNTVTGPALVSLGTYLLACLLYLAYIARTLDVAARSLFDFDVVRRLIRRRATRT